MKNKNIIEQMTLEEKAGLLSGANFWNTKEVSRLDIPSIMITDGPHGLRKQGGKADHLGLNKSIPATCFPTAATLANSWDSALLEKMGTLLGAEAAAEDVNAICGPGLNIKRNPLCGRNFEYFSEDPYLAGKLAASMVRGIQSNGVAACPKHFAVNSQETRRMVINEVVDERALREIYLEGFRIVVEESKPKTIMTSYNQINGTFANENQHLMQDILYGEWGFDGVAVTDWGGENDRVKGLLAGNQLEMPSSAGQTDREIVAAVREGVLDESVVDESVDAILNLINETMPHMGKGRHFDYEEHHKAAREAASQSIVLLKNEDNILPLKPKSSIAIIGDFAENPRYQGAGSSLINPTRIENSLDVLTEEDFDIIGYEPGFDRYKKSRKNKFDRAVELAKKADTVLLFLGLNESLEAECIDRPHMNLPEQQLALLEAVRSVAKKIVVVLFGGAPIEMPWASGVDSILHTYLGGQAGGGAIADVITGRVNPSGKLAESYPICYEDCPSAPWFPGEQLSAEHRESIFIGYRYYDTANIEVQWPFGYGLSYTTFEYSDISFDKDTVSFNIKNIGKVAGAEIAEVYISKKDSKIFRAEKELKGFAKVFLQPEETQSVTVSLDEHTFKYYHTGQNAWVEESGDYDIMVGASSRDIRLSCQTSRQNDSEITSPYGREDLSTYLSADVHNVSESEFELLLGTKIPRHTWDKEAPLGYNDTIGQGQYKKGFARFLYNLVRLAHKYFTLTGNVIWSNNVYFAIHLPYRQLARMTGGIIDMPMLDGILVMVNGQFWKGLRQMMKARKVKRKLSQ